MRGGRLRRAVFGACGERGGERRRLTFMFLRCAVIHPFLRRAAIPLFLCRAVFDACGNAAANAAG